MPTTVNEGSWSGPRLSRLLEPTSRAIVDPLASQPLHDADRYVFGGVFASGGIGLVRRGEDRRLKRTIAIKELQHDSPRAQQRFALEAALTARLQHPGIVPMYDFGWHSSGKPYYCMKLVDGESLEAKIHQADRLEPRLRLLEHVVAVADAIAYAHEQRVLHRDLKPANVLVGRFGETVVIDWGLAKDLSGESAAEVLEPSNLAGRSGMTETGTMLGTLCYMPPEQATGGTVDARSDIYALGAILYHVLTGAPPFADVPRSQLAAQVLAGTWRGIRALDPAVPRELAAIAQRAMAREPAARYPSAAAFAEDLRRFQAGRLVSAHSYSFGEVARLWLRRNRMVVAVGSIMLLALVLTGLGAAWRIADERNTAVAAGKKAEAERDAAELARSEALAARQRAEDALAGEKAAREQAKTAADDALAQKQIAEQERGAAKVSEAGAKRSERQARRALVGQRRATHEAESQRRKAEDNLVRAEQEARRARDANRLAVAVKVMTTDPTTALALLLEVEDPQHTRGWTSAAVEALQRPASTAVLRGHAGYVVAASFSPSGRALVTASHDRSARVVALDGRAPPTILAEHDDALVDVAFSPDGRLIATASVDGTARLWREDGGSTELAGHAGPLTALAFSPDGIHLATASRDATVALWDTKTSRRLRLLVGHSEAVRTVAFATDGRRLVSSSDDGTARVWSLDGSATILAGHGGTVHDASFSSDGTRVVTAGHDRTVRVWQLGPETGDAEVLRGHTDAVYSAEFSPRGDHVVSASRDRTARVWSLADGQATVLRGHGDKIYAARFNLDGTMIATASRDGTARLWSVDGQEEPRELRGHKRPVVDVGFSSDGNQVFTAAEDGTARVWHAHGRSRQIVLRGHRGPVRRVEFMAAGSRLLTAGDDGQARMWSPASPTEPTLLLSGHSGPLLAATATPDGERALTASADGTLTDWSFANTQTLLAARYPREHFQPWTDDGRTRIALGRGHVSRKASLRATVDLAPLPGIPNFVGFDAARRRAVTSSTDTVWIIDLASGARVPLRGHEGEVRHAAFDRSGLRVITAADDRTARIWTLGGTAAPVLLRGHEGAVHYAAFSPDGTLAVTASWDATARVWDTISGEPLLVLAGHDKPLRSAEFSNDGTRIVTASDDRTARIWQVDGPSDAVILYGHEGPVLHAVFNADDRRVATGGSDGTARVWEAEFSDPALLRRRITSATTVCLAPEQRIALLGEDPEAAARRHRACETGDEQEASP
ncbi:protein kinase [Nannocystis sp. SCPEA4]|uniref:protein kinase domain-containing protein n=1 Tax=Nannocystis sp. SCPEA4 TaxID=2996787 RepID=UPI00226FF7B8|nr:protein kinase [Nannocystis sp. SCPEA4]MCY1060546.1 protein kinase [Nannocystis sp. SCPEA4]